MILRMVFESDLASLNIPLRYLSFSVAYLDSASRLCTVLTQSPRRSNYPRGSVVLHLTFHAIELFLKSAILEQNPNEILGTHDVQVLSKRYKKLYPGKKYEFHAPFIGRDPGDLSDDDFRAIYGSELLEDVRKRIKKFKKKNPRDQRHRYLTNTEGQPWDDDVGFEPVSFLVTIKKLKADIAQLAELIFPANNVARRTPEKARRLV